MIIADSHSCTGCAACYNVCTRNSISMERNAEGFLYPVIDEKKCIHCNRCKSVCPINQNMMNSHPFRKALAIRSNDEEVRCKSSSGGIFALLAKNTIDNGGVVVAASLSEDCRLVNHIAVSNIGDMPKLYGAKYLQSNIGKVYVDVKEYLSAGKRVLFVGTPCQIEGILSFLGEKPVNLLLVDFICHGIPSPLVWGKYIDSLCRKKKASPIFVNFRDKSLGWKMYSLKIDFDNDSEYLATHYEDLYLRGYIYKNLFMRESCYNCMFRKENRLSDITIADCWGASKVCPELDDDKGLSMVLVHSEEGYNKIRLLLNESAYKELNYEEALAVNPSAISSPQRPRERDRFFSELKSNKDIRILLKRYCGLSLSRKIKHMIKKNSLRKK